MSRAKRESYNIMYAGSYNTATIGAVRLIVPALIVQKTHREGQHLGDSYDEYSVKIKIDLPTPARRVKALRWSTVVAA